MKGGAIFFWMCAGFILWSGAFIVLYAGHAYACETGWDPAMIRLSMGALIFVHAAALVVFLRKRPVQQSPYDEITKWTLTAGLVAVLATFAPALLLSPCL